MPFFNNTGNVHVNTTMLGVHIMFIPPRPSNQPDTMSLEENTFMVIECCHQQQNIPESSRKVPDTFAHL